MHWTGVPWGLSNSVAKGMPFRFEFYSESFEKICRGSCAEMIIKKLEINSFLKSCYKIVVTITVGRNKKLW